MVPKNDIIELYSHAKISISREDIDRVTKSKRVTIGDISLKIVEPDKLQYRSATKQEAGSTYLWLFLGLISFLLFVLFILDEINLTIMEKNERKERDEQEAESYT